MIRGSGPRRIVLKQKDMRQAKKTKVRRQKGESDSSETIKGTMRIKQGKRRLLVSREPTKSLRIKRSKKKEEQETNKKNKKKQGIYTGRPTPE